MSPPVSTVPTHAGAVVVRITPSGRQYHVVSPRLGEPEWVFPKDHIKQGETA